MVHHYEMHHRSVFQGVLGLALRAPYWLCAGRRGGGLPGADSPAAGEVAESAESAIEWCAHSMVLHYKNTPLYVAHH